VTELYAIKDVSRVFGLRESRLRYWFQIGFLWPSVRRQGRVFYTFQDLVLVKAAKVLLDSGVPVERVRGALAALRTRLPPRLDATSSLKICSDGQDISVVDTDVTDAVPAGEVVMAFSLASLAGRVNEILGSPRSREAIPQPVDDLHAATEPHEQPTAYHCFREAQLAHDRGDNDAALAAYARALELEPSLAAAHTNVGNIRFLRNELAAARAAYESALEHDPGQPEARFNLGNLLDDLGETELAIAELRRVCSSAPEFADAHYNLGLLLARVGGTVQARVHLSRYLELDPRSEWSVRARAFLARVGPGQASEPRTMQ
jgi:tetratricopeptide (TPR) repeat protein